MHTDGNGAEQRNAKPADLSPGKEVPPPNFQTGSKGFFQRFLCALCALSRQNQLRLLGKC